MKTDPKHKIIQGCQDLAIIYYSVDKGSIRPQ